MSGTTNTEAIFSTNKFKIYNTINGSPTTLANGTISSATVIDKYRPNDTFHFNYA